MPTDADRRRAREVLASWWPEYKEGIPPFWLLAHPWDELVSHIANTLAAQCEKEEKITEKNAESAYTRATKQRAREGVESAATRAEREEHEHPFIQHIEAALATPEDREELVIEFRLFLACLRDIYVRLCALEAARAAGKEGEKFGSDSTVTTSHKCRLFIIFPLSKRC